MLKVLGCNIGIREAGHGPAIVLLHGNPDTSLLWRGVIEHLASDFRCIAPDLPGYGQSSAPADFDYSLDGQAAFVDELVRALGLSAPITVVGHDFGAIFALAWMVRHPQKVGRAVIGNTAFFSDYRWHFWARVWRRPVLGEINLRLMNRPAFRLVYRHGSRDVPLDYVDATYDMVTHEVKRSILRLYRAVGPASFHAWEADLQRAAAQVPLLVLWGDSDPYVPVTFAERFGARRVLHFPRAGHWLPVIEPAAFAREIHRFVADAAC